MRVKPNFHAHWIMKIVFKPMLKASQIIIERKLKNGIQIHLAASAHIVYRCLGPAALREKAGPERIEASKGPGEVCPRVVHILDKVRGRIEVPLLQQRKLTLTKTNSKTTSTGITMTTKKWHPAQTKCHKTPLDLRWVQFHDARLHSRARAHKYLCQPWLLPKCLCLPTTRNMRSSI